MPPRTSYSGEITILDFPPGLAELYAAFSRLRPYLKLPAEIPLDPLVDFVVQDCRLKLARALHLALLEVGGRARRAPLEHLYASRLAEGLGLGVLDLLHVAQAALLGDAVDFFVTEDQEYWRGAARSKSWQA